jgi:hypothetical protein
VSLFSDVDWFILLLVGGILLLGGNNKELLRTAGRMYAKVTRIRDEFLRDLKESVSEDPQPVSAAPSPPSTGIWEVGTARTISPLPDDIRRASLAKVAAQGPEPAKASAREASTA